MLLLDTNAFIWFVGDQDTLSEEITGILLIGSLYARHRLRG